MGAADSNPRQVYVVKFLRRLGGPTAESFRICRGLKSAW